MESKNRNQNITEKESKNEPKSLSEFLVHIFVVMILVAIIFYFSQKTILYLFGEKIYVLIIFGIGLFFFIKYIVLKISGILRKKNE